MTTYRDDGDMDTLVSQALDLASVGAASSRATSAQKWHLGDTIAGMQAFLELATEQVLEPQMTATTEAKVRLQQYTVVYNEFVDGQRVTRTTLVDYARCARVFTSGHWIRTCGLSFSHARRISRCVSAEEREAWITRTLQDGLSVNELQKAINAAAHSRRERSQSTLICAATGNAITNLTTMIEVRLHLTATEEISYPSGRRDGTRRAAIPRSLWFESRSALLVWLAAVTPAGVEV